MGKYAVVDQYYNQYLGRNAEAGGAEGWDNTIDQWMQGGMTGDQVNSRLAQEFQNSAEGQAYAAAGMPGSQWDNNPAQTAAQQTGSLGAVGQQGGINLNGHYIPVLGTRRDLVQGYGDEKYYQGQGETYSGYGDSAQGMGNGMNFTYDQGGYWTDAQGNKYARNEDLNNATMGGDGYNPNYYFSKYDDSRNTYRESINWADDPTGYFTRANSGNNDMKHNWEMLDPSQHADWDQSGNTIYGRLKTQDKAAHHVQWTRQGDKWVPNVTGMSGMDTNERNRRAVMAAAAVASMGAAAYFAPVAAGAGLGGSGVSAGNVMSMANFANTASGANNPYIGLAGAAMGGYGGLSNLASGSGSFMDALRVAQAGAKLYGGYQNLTQDPSNPTGGGGRPGMVGGAQSQMPGGAGGGSGMGWLDQLFNMGGAMYSANKNDNYADELRQERARSLAERQPFLDRMNELRGDEGAERYRTGGTYQAAERVAANRFNRQAAKGGTLANDTDRQRLLQDHFMGSLEKERAAARGDMQSFDESKSRDAFMKALEMDRMKNSPLFAGAAYGAGGGQGTLGGAGGLTPQVIDMLKQIPGGLQYLQSLMGGNPNLGQMGPGDYNPGTVGPEPYVGSGDLDDSSLMFPPPTDYSAMMPGGSWYDDGMWGE